MNPHPNLEDFLVVGFDLDDTLHSFRNASKRSCEAVFEFLDEEFALPSPKTRFVYSELLGTAQATHFTENIPSREYRTRRFRSLLTSCRIVGDTILDEILDIYECTFLSNISPTEGAIELVKGLNQSGHRIAIITEGPIDAQVRTVKVLGLEGFVDAVVASSESQVSKSDGLFDIALKKMGCTPSDMVFVGDNPDRDIRPCKALGIRSILFDAEDKFTNISPRVRSLAELQPMKSNG